MNIPEPSSTLYLPRNRENNCANKYCIEKDKLIKHLYTCIEQQLGTIKMLHEKIEKKKL